MQNGWLRANERKLDPAQSTLLEPVPSLRAADVRPLPEGRFAEVTVPLYYEGHAYRRGSRIRLTIVGSGRRPAGVGVRADAARAGRATRLDRPLATVPVAAGPAGRARRRACPTGLPPCPGLRGEPCRAYQPYVNRSALRCRSRSG